MIKRNVWKKPIKEWGIITKSMIEKNWAQQWNGKINELTTNQLTFIYSPSPHDTLLLFKLFLNLTSSNWYWYFFSALNTSLHRCRYCYIFCLLHLPIPTVFSAVGRGIFVPAMSMLSCQTTWNNNLQSDGTITMQCIISRQPPVSPVQDLLPICWLFLADFVALWRDGRPLRHGSTLLLAGVVFDESWPGK